VVVEPVGQSLPYRGTEFNTDPIAISLKMVVTIVGDRATQLLCATYRYCIAASVSRVWHHPHAKDIDRACVPFGCILCPQSHTLFNLLSVDMVSGHFSATTEVIINEFPRYDGVIAVTLGMSKNTAI